MRRLAALLLAIGAAPALGAEYEISDYAATLRLTPGSTDVQVELDITYDVRSGVKSDGFKYVGKHRPVDLAGHEEGGGPIPVRAQKQNEYQVSWTFTPVSRGSRRVFVRFRLHNALKGSLRGGNVLDVPWIGVFRVPVRRARYRVVAPGGIALSGGGKGATIASDGGSSILMLDEAPLATAGLSVRMTPALAEALPDLSWLAPVFMVGLIGGVVGFMMLATRKGWIQSTGGSGGDSSSGGCGGGGCGGGGCGGGGCGG